MAKKAKAATKSKASKVKAVARKIKFNFYAPLASSVRLAGNFNNWDANSCKLRKCGDGNWAVMLDLKPGKYQYRYLVDSNWENEQKPVECVPNPFGSWNSVIEVK